MKNFVKVLLGFSTAVALLVVGLVVNTGSDVDARNTDLVVSEMTSKAAIEATSDSFTDVTTGSAIDGDIKEPIKKELKCGIYKEDGNIHFYNILGKKEKNTFIKYNGKKYYFNKYGNAITDQVKKIDGKRYYFKKNGVMLTEHWKTVGDKTYYFNKKGVAVTGKKMIGNYLCYFKDNGVLERRIDKRKKMIAVTYDDGPSIYTHKILDVLEQYDAKATFFVVGNRIDDYKDSVQREGKLNMEVGNHTWTHAYLYKSGTTADKVKSEIKQCSDKIKEVTGKECRVYRPCGGGVTETIKNNCGFPMFIWSVDTIDWKTRNSTSIQNEVYGHVQDGDIILMHDLYSTTAEASKYIIPYLVDQGYQLVTIPELAELRGEKLKNGVQYYSFRPSGTNKK